MTAVYAVALVLGLTCVLGWIAAVTVSDVVAGWAALDPDRRFGRRGRVTVGATSGFGLAGMSASYAGWPWAAAAAAAIAGAVLIGALARNPIGRTGPEER